MGFKFPDLVIESVIRDGLANLKANPTIIDDVFSELLELYASRKYGADEIQRIKDYVTGAKNDGIAVVHSFHEAAAKSPCYSIQLASDNENPQKTALDDFVEDKRVPITDQATLDSFKKVTNLIPLAYDPVTGMVAVDDSVDLSDVYGGHIYEDGDGTEFEIQGGLSNETGEKFFFIERQQDPNITDPGLIRSFITEEQYEQRMNVNETSIIIGCHSKEALLTKYLYILLKYFIESRKDSLVKRCFEHPVIKGSDFTRDMAYQGDQVFTRFLTVSGRTEDEWRSDQVDIIDGVEIDADPVDC